MCEYYETCSRRGALGSCENGDFASWTRCKRAVKKGEAFPDDEHQFNSTFAKLKEGLEDPENKVRIFPDGLEQLSDFIALGCKLSPARNEDGTLAGYGITTQEGLEFFVGIDGTDIVSGSI